MPINSANRTPTILISMVLILGLTLGGCERKVQLKNDAIDDEISQFCEDVWKKFDQEKFADLEAIANKITAERARFRTGSWKIVWFHFDLQPRDDLNNPKTWTWYAKHIHDWETQYPQSVTARILHIDYLTGYAWNARGKGWANEVKPEAWPLFAERLAQAHEQLVIASKLGQRTPMIAYVAFNIALGESWSKKDTLEMFNEVKNAYPDFWEIDRHMAYYLLPRWYGEDGEWEQFALDEIRRSGGVGEESYARTVYTMQKHYGNIFKESKVQWPIVRTGFQQMIARYPHSQLLLNEFAYMASLAWDRPTARALFKEIGAHADPEVWGTVGAFKQSRTWANWTPPNDGRDYNN